MPLHQQSRQRLTGVVRILALLVLMLGAPGAAHGDDVTADEAPLAPPEKEGIEAELRVTGMTFVGSRGEQSEFVLRARRGVFEPNTHIAKLQEV